jgi:beta-lactamase superfamily II metal-dependent hydrolase
VKKLIFFFVLWCALFSPFPSFFLPIEDDSVFALVVDSGAGFVTATRKPGDFYMVYDAGNYPGEGKVAFEGISDVIPQTEEIDLFVLSHNDADHLGAVKKIFAKYTVKKVLRSGLERLGTQTWVRSNTATRDAARNKETLDINLKYFEFPMGSTYRFGDTQQDKYLHVIIINI